MKSSIVKKSVLSFDEAYPASNRLVSPELKSNQIKISFDGGYCVATYTDALNDLSMGVLTLGNPLSVPACDIGSGSLSYVFQTSEISLWLSPEALVRLLTMNLSSEEYFSLRARYGSFFEIGPGKYDPLTGSALKPIDIVPSRAILQFDLVRK